MELRKITNNTFYFELPSIIGVYILDNSSCILIDTSNSKQVAQKVLKELKNIGLSVYGIINTHAHTDHCAGNNFIQNETNCKIYACKNEAYILENPLIGVATLYSAFPFKALKNKFLLAESCIVTDIITPGILSINGKDFKIIDLKGHSINQIGVKTPDNILFSGDSIIHPKILKENYFTYIMQVEDLLKSIELVNNEDYSLVVASHGGVIDDLSGAVKENKYMINNLLDEILTYLIKPNNRDNMVSYIISKFNLPLNRSQYFLISATISALLAYLSDSNKIKIYTTANELLYVAK